MSNIINYNTNETIDENYLENKCQWVDGGYGYVVVRINDITIGKDQYSNQYFIDSKSVNSINNVIDYINSSINKNNEIVFK